MSDDLPGVIIGFLAGVFLGGMCIGGCLAGSVQREAVEQGHARYVLESPTDRKAVFQWNTNCTTKQDSK